MKERKGALISEYQRGNSRLYIHSEGSHKAHVAIERKTA